jgi:hypothetical protein
MLVTTTEKPSSFQIPKLEGKVKTKTIILGSSLVLGLLFYSQSIKPAKVVGINTPLIGSWIETIKPVEVVELSTNTQSSDYTKWVESLAKHYQLLAEQQIKTPGNSCYKTTIKDCLEQLKPDKPKQFESLEPAKAINSDLKQLGYQVRLDAINFAQEKIEE